jgi:hypothetical protein
LLITTKADQDRTVVIINKDAYQQKIEMFLPVMKRVEQTFIKNKYNSSTQFALTSDMLCASAGRDHIGSYIVNDVHKNNPENLNNWGGITEQANYCMVVLLQQYGLYWLIVVI